MHIKRRSQNLRQKPNYNYNMIIIIIIIIFVGAQDYQNLERLLPSILPQLHLWLSQFLRCVIAPLSLHFVLCVHCDRCCCTRLEYALELSEL